MAHHRRQGKTVTLTAVQPEGRFGVLGLEGEALVRTFQEKPKGDDAWINGGFMACQPAVFETIPPGDDGVAFEEGPLRSLAARGELAAYKHRGFWKAMDTLKDKNDLNALWRGHKAPWALWERTWNGRTR